jgi:3',5'-cyclic-AMP phosphodiesterase
MNRVPSSARANVHEPRMTARTRLAIVPLTAMIMAGCLNPAEGRATIDETIGRGRVGDTSIEVEDGLAAIRGLEPGSLALWGKAPLLRVRVVTGVTTPENWTLTVENTMTDAVLEAVTDSGQRIVAQPLPQALPTKKSWSLGLPALTTTTLTIRSARGEPTRLWRFALLSDVQEAIDTVKDIYVRMNADPSIDFVVSAGDLTERGSVEELIRFQRELERLNVPFFPTLGNHELGNEDGEPFQRFFGRANFRFVHGNMQFTFLDSASATIEPRVYNHLDAWLSEGRERTHAVLMHIPPVDPIGVRNGSFANRNEANKLLARLAEASVDLTLYGHIHSYYSFSNASIPAYISGGGGSIPERFDGIGRHYMTFDIDPERGVLSAGLVRIDRD